VSPSKPTSKKSVNDYYAPTHSTASTNIATPLRLVARIRSAYLSICRCRDTIFSPHGITTDQYSLLSIVRREQSISQSELSNAMFADPNTIGSMVALLEKRGILKRNPSPSDGRVRLVSLTSEGDQLFETLSKQWEPMRRRLARCFEGEAGQHALQVLEQVCCEMVVGREEFAPGFAEKALSHRAVSAPGSSLRQARR
jgi:DNA-binding MarR family transcriptional regulator